jgi:Transposase IS4
MSIIVNLINSYAFQINLAKNPWKTLEIQELYYFFGYSIKLSLWKHPPRTYSWSLKGILSQAPLLKNRFRSILSNFYLKDRGLNSI